MRYMDVDTISFTNSQGNTVAIKDMREYPDYVPLISLKIKENDKLDEIATRSEIYGDEAELQSYKIFEHNKIKIWESNFDFAKIQKLEIPL